MYLMLSTKAITLLYALLRHIFCQLFSMKKNFRCATHSVFDYNSFQDCGRPDRSGGRFHFRMYLSNQRQGKVNFRMQSVNQGCLNLTSVPSAEQQ